MENRVYNFSAGPAALPLPVLKRAQEELLALPGVGASVMEISHRSKDFIAIIEQCEANLRKLMGIPDNYKVLFLQGGAQMQFAMVPMNLLGGKTADYIISGSWSKKAIEEAKKIGNVNLAWDGSGDNFNRVPTDDELKLTDGAPFAYYCSNETIQGVQFQSEPNVGDVPLVCDSSSDIMCRPLDISKYGILYACAQKNAGPAGVTVVIIRDDLLERCPDTLPSMLNYRVHAEAESMFNTPPCFSIYMVKLITDWLLNDIGGIDKMYAINCEKASLLYDAIDASEGFYIGHAKPDCRSIMNVPFRMQTTELDEKFLGEAKKAGLTTLKGHRSVGGIRASIYNAMPIEGVVALRDFMLDFQKANG